MTDRQNAYLATLVAEREQTLVALVGDGGIGARRDAAKAQFLLAWHRAEREGTRQRRGLTTRQASEAISWLLNDVARDESGQTDRQEQAAVGADVPAGRYAIVAADGTVKFYRVDRPTEGRWSGYTFVKVQASEEWHPVRERAARNAILAAIAADPMGAMRRYGTELGRCGNCGRALTDETSRAMGIGPDCAARLNLDRSPYAEAARREMADRVSGRVARAADMIESMTSDELEAAVERAEAEDMVRREAEYDAEYQQAEIAADQAVFEEMLDADTMQAEARA